MKTKTLVLTGLLSFAASASLMAQVYSQNVVGYANVSLQANKFQMICNPLNGTTNNLNTVLMGISDSPAFDGALLYKFSGGGYQNPSVYIDGFGWDPDTTLAPGEGAFIVSPASVTLTFVGEVMQGALANPIPTGFNMVGSQVPQQASLLSLEVPGGDGDLVYLFDPATGYKNPVTFIDGYGWDDGGTPDPNGPTINVGEAFFFFRQTYNSSTNWARAFTVAP